MSEPVIKVENLSKRFVISHEKQERYTSLRDVVARRAKKIFSFPAQPTTNIPAKEDFWALKDINFEINKGDRVGIIGRNGAGKSTLLKILSRITEPTKGRVTIDGRVASLLEVGTGFHPELTGRENIFLNGAILGMSRAEIRSKFDEIVAFAEIEKFLDTPVKHYSSGMYVRLAFAVAAHLEPEILIVDEVLAVGDAQFQKKCLGKMEEVSKNEGRTILFVSHNMNVISALCSNAILLSGGRVIESGRSIDVMNSYVLGSGGKSSEREWVGKMRPGNNIIKLNSVRMIDASRYSKDTFSINEEIGIEMNYEVLEDNNVLWLGHNLYNSEGVNVFDTHSVSTDLYVKPHKKGKYSSVAWIPANLLPEGTFIIGSGVFNHSEHRIHFHERDIVVFSIVDTYDGKSARGLTTSHFSGVVRPLLRWNINAKK
ncbi:MAG: ABC transporter ATP-binding protein [Bacteroidetes bacterium]|nr:ABC transporter ATP-binding protein [Bacteroidota bacterium]